MKKNVGFIALDSSLSRWLSDQLRTTAPHTPAAQELREALGDLMDGTVDSLMLELGAEHPLLRRALHRPAAAQSEPGRNGDPADAQGV